MTFYLSIIRLIAIPDVIRQNAWLIVVLSCVFFAIGLLVGYLSGNRSMTKHYDSLIESMEHSGTVQKSINNNVGLGIIVYDGDKVLYYNKTIKALPGFLNGGGVPKTIGLFLDMYDKDNHLKSDYILSLENRTGLIRTNYVVGDKIYEIKILRKKPDNDNESLISEGEEKTEDEILDFVIVEDITLIKDDERRKKDLAANVSHELNTPLTVIRAYADLIEKLTPENMPSYEELSKWGNRILESSIRMHDIFEDFLVLSMSAQIKKMTIFDPYPLVDKAISNLNDYPNADNVTIVPPQKELKPLCFGTTRLIIRIITNLLTNAVKYIDYDGKEKANEIKINIVTIPDKVGIEVTDNGRGIPKKDIEHLFERFYRVDNSGSRDVGGSGLGLAIAKEIADIHDGNIEVVSDMKEGSSFTLFLPTAKATFARIMEDARSGVISDIPYYRGAMVFIAREMIEVSKSRNYTDIMELIERSKITDPLDKVADTEMIKLFTAFGEERYNDLIDELTYVDFIEEDEEYDDEDLEDEIEEVEEAEPVVSEEAEDQAAVEYAEEVLEAYRQEEALRAEIEERREQERIVKEQEEEERRKKKEMQEFLMQPVVQQSVKQTEKPTEKVVSSAPIRTPVISKEDFVKLENKEKTIVHPNTDKKMYNKGTKLFEGKNKINKKLTAEAETTPPPSDAEPIRSAVRQVLDEASASNKNTETEGKN